MNDFIVSCNGLIENTRYSYLRELTSKDYERACVIVSTQFSLPFDNLDQSARSSWCKYRYEYFKRATWKSMVYQQVDCKRDVIIWILFVSRGDRKLLNLPPIEALSNGIMVMWKEIDYVNGASNDYYRNTVMDKICKRLAAQVRDTYREVKRFFYLRIDSDDFISSTYLPLSQAIGQSLDSGRIQCAFFNFPCGLFYSKKTHKTGANIWPDSAFTFNCAFRETLDTTIWKWPHDRISYHVPNTPIVTTKPLWCTTVDHGNMQNKESSYFDLTDPTNENMISSIL